MFPLLSEVTAGLSALAPLALAEAWDNVGLLLEPPSFRADGRRVERLLLTIDLTRAVLTEAQALKADVIVAYHPPIFSGVKRLTAADPTQALILGALSAGIAVYSPHTALDAVDGGMNDWLADGAGPGKKKALLCSEQLGPRYKLVVWVPEDHTERLREALCGYPGVAQIGEYSSCSFGVVGEGTFLGSEHSHPTLGEPGKLERVRETRLEVLCQKEALPALPGILKLHHPYEEPAWEVHRLEPILAANVGMGRRVELVKPLSLNELVQRYKDHLGLKYLRVATNPEHAQGTVIRTLNVCAGAGGSVFEKAPPADLYVTGELRHHDILARLAHGASVVLTDHSNSERGYLPTLKHKILERLPRVEVMISEHDADPLRVV